MPPSECIVLSKCGSSMVLLFGGGGGQEFDLVSRFFIGVFLSLVHLDCFRKFLSQP